MQIKIGRVTHTAAPIVLLEEECFAEEQLTLQEIREIWWWIVTVDGVVAGCVGARPLAPLDPPAASGSAGNPRSWHIDRVAVRERFRGLGLGRRLLQAAQRQAMRDGVETLRTYTAPWNVWSSNLLIGLGWRLCQPEAGLDNGDGNSWNYWRKELHK